MSSCFLLHICTIVMLITVRFHSTVEPAMYSHPSDIGECPAGLDTGYSEIQKSPG